MRINCNTSLIFLLVISGISFQACGPDDQLPIPEDLDFRQEMRNFIGRISEKGKTNNPDFAIIPQNGIQLVVNGKEASDPLHTEYLAAIDAHGQEDLFYGYNKDDKATPTDERVYIQEFLDQSKAAGNTILVTDYCSSTDKMTDSYSSNQNAGYISFAADHRELDNIPNFPTTINNENSETITMIDQVQNFLYLINPGQFATKQAFINAVTATNYDLLIMDLFSSTDEEFTPVEVEELSNKANGGKRLVIAYMSIGEAEDYRYYWKNEWNSTKPGWLAKENSNWPGNYKVQYWVEDWQDVILGNGSGDEGYLEKVVNAGFDGVYLDIVAGFEFFE